MTNSEKNSIRNLKNLLKDMYAIVASNYSNDVNYAKKTMIRIVKYLDEAIISETAEYKDLMNVVIELYESMFPPKAGLSEFHIWDNNYEKRCKANREYEAIKTQIELILSTDQ